MSKHRDTRTGLSGLGEEQIAALVERTLGGDEQGWKALWIALAPFVERIAGRWRVTGRLAACRDERADIVVRVMGELREDGFRRLRELRDRLGRRDGSYLGWLSTVARNSALQHTREHAEYLGAASGVGGRRWVDRSPIPDAMEDEAPDPLRGIEARRILAFAREQLPPAQRDALDLWLQRREPAEIAHELGLADGAAATRLLRSAIARLRHEYAREGTAKKIDRCF